MLPESSLKFLAGRHIMSLGLGVLILLSGVSAGTAQDTDTRILAMNVTCDPNIAMSGQPVRLEVTVQNVSDVDLEFDFGWDGVEAFTIELWRDNDPIIQRKSIEAKNGISLNRILLLRPNEQTSFSIVLNRWVSTSLNEGAYWIKVSATPFAAAGETPVDTSSTEAAASRLTIVSPDEIVLSRIFSDLYATAFDTQKSFSERQLAKSMIAHSDSSLAVSQQIALIDRLPDHQESRDAIGSLAISRTKAGAAYLAQKYVQEDISPETKSCILESLRALSRSNDPEILGIVQSIVDESQP